MHLGVIYPPFRDSRWFLIMTMKRSKSSMPLMKRSLQRLSYRRWTWSSKGELTKKAIMTLVAATSPMTRRTSERTLSNLKSGSRRGLRLQEGKPKSSLRQTWRRDRLKELLVETTTTASSKTRAYQPIGGRKRPCSTTTTLTWLHLNLQIPKGAKEVACRWASCREQVLESIGRVDDSLTHLPPGPSRLASDSARRTARALPKNQR